MGKSGGPKNFCAPPFKAWFKRYAPLFRGGYRISERGGVRVTVKYQNAAFLRARARRFFPFYEIWGSPKLVVSPHSTILH